MRGPSHDNYLIHSQPISEEHQNDENQKKVSRERYYKRDKKREKIGEKIRQA